MFVLRSVVITYKSIKEELEYIGYGKFCKNFAKNEPPGSGQGAHQRCGVGMVQ